MSTKLSKVRSALLGKWQFVSILFVFLSYICAREFMYAGYGIVDATICRLYLICDLKNDYPDYDSLFKEELDVKYRLYGPWIKSIGVITSDGYFILSPKHIYNKFNYNAVKLSLSSRTEINYDPDSNYSSLTLNNDETHLRIRAKSSGPTINWVYSVRQRSLQVARNNALDSDRVKEKLKNLFTTTVKCVTRDGNYSSIGSPSNSSRSSNRSSDNNSSSRRSGIMEVRDTFTEEERRGVPPVPRLNIAILVVGTRGDVQPFIHFGQELQRRGHRVRLATHAAYRADVVEDGGLEFYPLGGDPWKLSEFMVRTGGRITPNFLNGQERQDFPEKVRMIRDIAYSTYPACTAPDPLDPEKKSFLADVIVSNPVSYGHIHVAQALSIPLHIVRRSAATMLLTFMLLLTDYSGLFG